MVLGLGMEGAVANPTAPKRTMAQFNVCPMKLSTLAFLCENDAGLSESYYIRDITFRELRGLLRNTLDGLELTLEETGKVFDLIHDHDSDSEEEEEEESEEEGPPPLPDTRPLINEEWIEQNPERWNELNEKPECCPVCLETDVDEWRGQLLCKSELFTRNRKCTHWFCTECFVTICGMTDESRRRCPMCQDPWCPK